MVLAGVEEEALETIRPVRQAQPRKNAFGPDSFRSVCAACTTPRYVCAPRAGTVLWKSNFGRPTPSTRRRPRNFHTGVHDAPVRLLRHVALLARLDRVHRV